MNKIAVKTLVKKTSAIVVLGMLIVAPLSNRVHAQTANKLYVSSSAGSVTQGALFQATIYAESNVAITTLQVYLAYDESKLQLTNTDYSTSAWKNELGSAVSGSGYYKFSRFTFPPYPTGKQIAGVMTFKALGNSGTTDITIDNSKSLMYNESATNALQSVLGTTVSLTGAVAAGQAPSPGTAIPASSTQKPAYTPPKTAGDNGTPTSPQAVTKEDTKEAVAYSRQEPTTTTAKAGTGQTVAVISKKSKLTPLTIGLIVASVAMTIIAIFVTIKVIQSRKATKLAGAAGATMESPSLDSNQATTAWANPNTGSTPSSSPPNSSTPGINQPSQPPAEPTEQFPPQKIQ